MGGKLVNGQVRSENSKANEGKWEQVRRNAVTFR